MSAGGLLILAVAAVGVLHTMVPDHWAPITLLARQNGWTRAETARAAATAGVGHTLSTLLIAVLVWGAGALFAARFGSAITMVSSLALVGFGTWIAAGSWRELRRGDGEHGHTHMGHSHLHRHAGGKEHRHWHEHHDHDWHDEHAADQPDHSHGHDTSKRSALLLILGSSPMVEGIPAFFAASRLGIVQVLVMAVVFAVSTIATYVVLCVVSARTLERLHLGPLERYGEVISGIFIALLGIVFLIFPVL